jgi:hypothetical protein
MNKLKKYIFSSPKIYFVMMFIIGCFLNCRLTSASGGIADPGELLPGNDDISGYQKKGSTALMTDEQSIFKAIDGAAEQYIRYGFIEGVEQMYSNSSADIDIRIFNQGTPANAKATFEQFKPSSGEVISAGVAEVVIDHSILTGYMVYYTRENIYIEIVTYEKSNFALNMAKQFYQNIDKKIGM